MDGNKKPQSSEPAPAPPAGGRFFAWPRTKLGWWAVGLALGTLLLRALAGLIRLLATPGGGAFNFGMLMVLLSIAGGIIGVIAVVRKKERSILAWYAILAGLFAVLLLIGDLVFAL